MVALWGMLLLKNHLHIVNTSFLISLESIILMCKSLNASNLSPIFS